jgi:hypothetical protein
MSAEEIGALWHFETILQDASFLTYMGVYVEKSSM